jgi:hypothetical protein
MCLFSCQPTSCVCVQEIYNVMKPTADGGKGVGEKSGKKAVAHGGEIISLEKSKEEEGEQKQSGGCCK